MIICKNIISVIKKVNFNVAIREMSAEHTLLTAVLEERTSYNQMWRWEYGSAVEQYHAMCVGYYELFGWESRQVSNRAMHYIRNDQ